MRLFSYKLTHDTGFAPNPFFGFLTLANCKPLIRRHKIIGDWIAGFTSDKLCGDNIGDERLIYLMHITNKITYYEYFNAQKYKIKIPDLQHNDFIYKSGDNIYSPLNEYDYSLENVTTIKNMNHWDFKNDCECMKNKIKDLPGIYVLISDDFYYFGKNAIVIDKQIRPDVPFGMAAHGVQTKNINKAIQFIEFIKNNYKKGIHGIPHMWPQNDISWKNENNN